jgi:lysophosphatidylcholine acyltransferase/lyso-PAF acetyltransferase
MNYLLKDSKNKTILFLQGNLILSNLGLAEKRVYHAALNGNSPRALHQKDD